MPDPLGYSIFLEPSDTIRAFRAREDLRTTVRWDEMMHAEHAVAFTAAKLGRLDLLTAMREALDREIANGGTYASFRDNIVPQLQAAGWWGVVTDPRLTGTSEPVVINDRRLRNIYTTNVRMSIASGNWARVQRMKKALPLIRYVPSRAEKKRREHMEWYDIVLPVDHPFWQTHFPPNGWGCKCGFEQLSDARLARLKERGLTVREAKDIPSGGLTVKDALGRDVFVPDGIDKGFGYNPGTAHLRVLAEKAVVSIERAIANGLDAAAEQTVREIVKDAAFDQFLALPEGDFPIAILSAQEAALISAPSRLVVLPTNIVRKQKGELPEISAGHPELGIEAYRRLPDLIRNAVRIAQQGENRLHYFSDTDGQLWKAVVRQDGGRSHPAVVSFHRSSARKMRAETRNLQIIYDPSQN